MVPPPEPPSSGGPRLGPIVLPRWRSFRLRVLAVVLVVSLVPPALVSAAYAVDGALLMHAQRSLERACAAAAAVGDLARHGVAQEHHVDLQWTGALGRVQRAAGDDGPHAVDAWLMTHNRDLAGSTAGAPDAPGCTVDAVRSAYGCQASCIGSDGAPLVATVHGARLIRGLHDRMGALLKLSLWSVAIALLLAWWLGWRTNRALNLLRQQAWTQVPLRSFGGLQFRREDEIGDLALAVEALAQALEERRRSNEAFAADLAHEFKNPVAAVRAAAESMEGSGDARTARLARVLADASGRLDALVTQFLELARAEAGMPNEPRETVDLLLLCQGVAESMRARAELAQVQLVVASTAVCSVVGVASRLESMVRNLMDNAVGFAGEGGWVRVELAGTSGAVELAVRDSGPGMTAEQLQRVFDRFFTTRGERHGTGLGLALVRAVAEAHGGGVRAESPPGGGACFVVRLPATTEQPAQNSHR